MIQKLTFITILFCLGCNLSHEKNSNELIEKKKNGENGTLKEKFFVDNAGLKQGKHYIYYESGKLKEVFTFKDGKQSGYYFEKYENGNLKTKCRFENNVQRDTIFYFYESGPLKSYVVCDDHGVKLKEAFFHESGTPKNVQSYFYNLGRISAYKTYFKDGKVNLSKSKFVRITRINNSQKIRFDLVGGKNKGVDSINLYIIEALPEDVKENPKVLKLFKFKDSKNLTFELEKEFYRNNRITILVDSYYQRADGNTYVDDFYVQLEQDNFGVNNLTSIR